MFLQLPGMYIIVVQALSLGLAVKTSTWLTTFKIVKTDLKHNSCMSLDISTYVSDVIREEFYSRVRLSNMVSVN